MSSAKKLMGTTAVGGALAIEDVFSTYLYTGNGSTQTITNGIDLAGEGGLVWLKSRSFAADHFLFDTDRGALQRLLSNATNAETTFANTLTSFNADGFSIGSFASVNFSAEDYASWTFRKAPRFFDVVTYTGDGVAGRAISHNLGVEPGFIVVKSISSANNWAAYHKNLGATKGLLLNSSAAEFTSVSAWNDTSPTSLDFTVGTSSAVNSSGATYVAYLFAHDPLGPSGEGSDGLIACGSYTGNGSTTARDIELGWEPQWLLIKNASASVDWYLSDETRGMHSQASGQGNNLFVLPNSSAGEGATGELFPYSRGFTLTSSATATNASGNTYIYIAIRRGPMRQPTDASEVFNPVAYTADNSDNRLVDTGLLTDAAIVKAREASSSEQPAFASRLTGRGWVSSSSTAAEIVDVDGLMAPPNTINNEYPWQTMSGFGVGNDSLARFNYLTDPVIAYAFRRAPGFFDVVAYTGDGVAGRTVPHNLGVAPEMMIIKGRTSTFNWGVYHTGLNGSISPEGYLILLNSANAEFSASTAWNSTTPTDAVFTLGTNATVNQSTGAYIAYLFATLPGISKVGSYTGNGTSQTINCGFTSGARFILIKRTDGIDDWYVWDTERGIVAANDPHLSLNTTAAEVTTDDSVDPDSSGFIVNQVSPTNINVSSATYIYLAIA